MSSGRLITVEGLDGAGKSTLIAGLVPALRDRGHDVEVLREPGGVEVAERIRTLVKDPALTVHARAEALLYAAARAALVEEKIRPALAAGRWVVLDRFVDSSLAYKGAGGGLGVEAVAAINAFATGGLRADRTLLLRVEAAERARRLSGRGEPADRLEREPDEFFAAIAAALDALAAAEPERFAVLDAGQPPESLVAAALSACGQGGPDLLLHQGGARRGVEERLRARVNRQAGVLDQRADALGDLDAARLAQHLDIVAADSQRRYEPGDERALAGTVEAFDGDQATGRHARHRI